MDNSVKKIVLAFVLCAALPSGGAWAAREAAFVDQRSASRNFDDGAVVVEPRSDIDLGEGTAGAVRRETVVFVNQSASGVKVTNLVANDDGNVKSAITSDDCSKQGEIEPQGRCAVVVEITPSMAGIWSVDVLLTHNGLGRMARAHLFGKVSGSAGTDRRETGLLLSAKDAKPIDFGSVEPVGTTLTRSVLMVNDSPDPISILSIDLIAAENGLERLSQGCAADLTLKSGESCPITLAWKPSAAGSVSTDVIIRHTGKLGFAVIPVRGSSRDASGSTGASSAAKAASKASAPQKYLGPPTAEDLESIVGGKIPQITMDSLPSNVTSSKPRGPGVFQLIGTTGSKAILVKPNGETAVAGVGETVADGDKKIRVLDVGNRSVTVMIGKTRKTLMLGASSEIVDRAMQARGSREKSSDDSQTKTSPDRSEKKSSVRSITGG